MRNKLTKVVLLFAILLSVGGFCSTAQAKTYYLVGTYAGTKYPSALIYKGNKMKISGAWQKGKTSSKAYDAPKKALKKQLKFLKSVNMCMHLQEESTKSVS